MPGGLRFTRVAGRLLPLILLLAVVAGASSTRAAAATSAPAALAPARAADAPITLAVDAREAPRKLLHARLVIPAAPGPLTLCYPKWIPGEHAPTGPIVNLAGPRLSAGGRAIAWTRDSVEMWTFHCVVPEGARTVEADLDFLGPTTDEGYSAAASATAKLALISWNQVLLYPAGRDMRSLTFAASLTLPQGWKFATPLPVARQTGAVVEFGPVTLETLVDSPVMAGEHFRSLPLNPGDPRPVTLDIAADSPAALELSPEHEAACRRLVAEAGALFGARHYQRYHFLLALSDHIAHFGLEHHECSDDQLPERSLTDATLRLDSATLLPHEYVHSWNGKYRRPADLATPDYLQPMKTDLLWVYEGLTQYLGLLLTARSGLITSAQYADELAVRAAKLDHRPGRAWRPLVDTAVAAQILYEAPPAWASARRGVDFYDEMLLIWLEADALIRLSSGGQRTLDDFCHRFLGGASGTPTVVPYTLDDVVAALNEVAPHDWRGFLAQRVEKVQERAPLGGIEACGWKLTYADSASEVWRASEKDEKEVDLRCSIGLVLGEDGAIKDVVPGMTAAKAGVGPGMKLVAVNERRFSPDLLREVVKGTKAGGALELLVDNGEFFRTCRLSYRDGERYPRLERVAGKPDLLAEIVKARALGAR
ncbi:MAG: M61 family metallopeptidase [Candidatus Eisenbacteria bacterium]|nr:M61 family metallopeptidase [Candidatus Eisenbacteria bacterium]